MADKGFILKILIPTDDGFTISENGLENTRYYLTYNLSNRSYQLSDKFKITTDFQVPIDELCFENNIDRIVLLSKPEINIKVPIMISLNSDISATLNHIIDEIDKREE